LDRADQARADRRRAPHRRAVRRRYEEQPASRARSCSAGTSCSRSSRDEPTTPLRRGGAQSRRSRLRARRPNERVDAVSPEFSDSIMARRSSRRPCTDRRTQVLRHGRSPPRVHAESRPPRRRLTATSQQQTPRGAAATASPRSASRSRSPSCRLIIPRTRARSRATALDGASCPIRIATGSGAT
jgi:hypothetical protein